MGKYIFSVKWNFTDYFKFLSTKYLFHYSGAIGWSLAGCLSSDKAILKNFSHQIPMFLIRYFNFLI